MDEDETWYYNALWIIIIEGMKDKLKTGEPLTERQQEIYSYFKAKGAKWTITGQH